MPKASEAPRRHIRPGVYGFFFLVFALIVFLTHLPLVRLPYFWDEAGQFIPAALDLMRSGALIPHSATPNIHPPAVMAYLAAVWRVAGFSPESTRAAMLSLAALAVLAGFLLAIELGRDARGAPAFLAAGLLCASPLFFAQSLLAQLDAPAMLFTTLALLMFLQDRIRWSAAFCVVLVLVKETGAVVPLVFAIWLAVERRWRDAACYLAPAGVLAGWILVVARTTGYWAGNAEFVRYNLLNTLHPGRLAFTFVRRLYYLGFANLHWLGIIAVVYAWRRTRIFQGRSWKVAWTLVGAHVVLLTIAGGAELERYLLPVIPILYAAMAAGLSMYSRVPQLVCSLVLMAALIAANFVNPPYPFPYENNLAFADFLALQSEAADYLSTWHPDREVHSVWPLTAELSRPELGFVRREIPVHDLPDLSKGTLEAEDWSQVEILVAFSRTWDPRVSLNHWGPLERFWQRFRQYLPNATEAESRERVPFPVEAHFERRGQWLDIFVNPRKRDGRPQPSPGLRALNKSSLMVAAPNVLF